MRTNFKIFKILVFFLLTALTLKAQEKQNALLIILDDMNDYIGVMGGHPQAKTPNIDRLAKEGVYFSNAHSSAPICAPSRASFLSGLYPSITNNFGFGHIKDNAVLANSKFIMEYAAENGFETYSTGKIFHRSVDDPSKIKGENQDQGPFAWDGANAIAHPSVPEPFRSIGTLNGSLAPLSDVPPGGWRNDYNASSAFKYVSADNRDKMCDELSADFVCQWVDELEEMKSKGVEKPFFMAYGGMKPHTPHVAPQHFFDLYPLDKLVIPEILKNDLKDTYAEHFSSSGFNDYDSLLESYATQEEGLRRYVQSKLACISFADSLVGVIVDKIRNSSFTDNTVIILCGDNGFHMGEKFRLAKNTLWEESTRVPFILQAPGYESSMGTEVTHPIGLIDIYPTFKDLCGMTGDTKKNEQGADLDGHSLKAFMENPNTTSWLGPKVALEAVVNPSSSDIALQNYAVRSKDFRYIQYPSGEEELYDHSKDNNEWRNLIFDPNYTDVAQELRDELKALVPGVSFEKRQTVSYLYFDDFEAYNEGDDLLSKGYKQKSGEATTTTLEREDENKFARNISVDGSLMSMRKSVKNLTPDKLYFFEASTRTETSVSAGSWDAITPNTISGHICKDWKSFSVPLRPNPDSWSGGTSMTLWINSAQNKPLDVDNFKFYAAELIIESPKGVDVSQLMVGDEYQFEASARPESEPFVWSVEDGSGSASIDQTGKLTAITAGTAQVITTMENYPSVNCTTEVIIWEGMVYPAISITEIEDPILVGVPVQFSATLNPDYQMDILWSIDDESKAIINQTTGFLLPLENGTITVTAELYNNEEVYTTKQVSIEIITSIDEVEAFNFKIYPNPSNGTFFIDGGGISPHYKVYDAVGRLIKTSSGSRVNLNGYSKGIYYLVIDENNIKKIIIR